MSDSEESEVSNKKASKVDKDLLKLASKTIFSASHVTDRQRTLIPISPCLDNILGGGVTSGSLIIIRGQYKAGKTTTCLHFAKKAQEAGYKIYYLDIEARLTQRDLLSIPGLDLSPEKFQVCAHSDEKILTGEEFIAIAELKLKLEKKIVVVFDSFSQLISQDNMTTDIRDRTRDSMPLTLSKFCKRALPVLNVNDNICIGITHDIANQGPGMATKVEASGRKIQYANSFKLAARWATEWKEGDQIVGQDIHWECENSALGPPNREGIGKLRYGIGLDEVAELIPVAIDLCLIKAAGSWFYLDEETKFHGEDKLVAHLRNDPDAFNTLQQKIKDRLL